MRVKRKHTGKLASRVFQGDLKFFLIKREIEFLATITLASVRSKATQKSSLSVLPYDSSKAMAYGRTWCEGGNDCTDGSFDNDCTHFMCHCLNAGGVKVPNPSATCSSGLCIRVNDLAAAMSNAVSQYSNVKRLDDHSQSRQGDFCFIPSWFGLRKEHVMMLADVADPTGAKVIAHTNNRCGEFVSFEGADCVYYRIEDA